MSDAKNSLLTRFLPSLTDLAFIMPLVFLFGRGQGAKLLIGDGDTGWHIRTGQWIMEHGRVPDHDIFSFSKPGQPWFAWEWLWDVVFGWLHQKAGLAAVAVASMILLSFTFALLFRLTRRACPNPFIAIGVTLMATAGSSMHWLARPHLFTLFFTVVFYWILEDARQGRTRRLILLPFLMVLWANLHGGFLVGTILIGAYVAGEFVSWLLASERTGTKALLAQSKPYLLALAGCVGASLLNPYGYHLHAHVYRFLTSSNFYLRYIQEYQSTSFQTVLALWYEPMLLLGAVAAAWCVYRKRFAQALLVAAWAHLGLFAVRNMPIYLLIAAPPVANMLYEWLELLVGAHAPEWLRKAARSLLDYGAGFDALDRLPRVYATSAVAAVLLSAVFFTPNPPWIFRAEYDPQRYPAAALQVLRSPQVAGNVYTIDEWGDFLIYSLYPNAKVFVDGRFDFYGPEFTEKYLGLNELRYGWEQTLNQYGIGTMLLPVDAPLARALKLSSRWQLVYDDGVAIVFRRAAAAEQGSQRYSAVSNDGEIHRGRATTKVQSGDLRVTQHHMRSESL